MMNQFRSFERIFFSSLALISVSASQSPVITIASRASPNRSEIRFVSSPIPTKSAVREIRISRPDSPSISINNRPGISNSPLAYTNGADNAFHISLGTPSKIIPRDLSVSSPPPSIHRLGRTSPVNVSENHGLNMRKIPSLYLVISSDGSTSRFSSG